LAAIVAGAMLWAPVSAFACSGGPSAVNVYAPCVPTGSGNKPASGGKKKVVPTHSGGSTRSSRASTTVPSRAAKALKHAGRDRRRLAHLLHYGTARLPAPRSSNAAAAEPSALGSAFDLGSGPTALLIVLAGTVILLLGGSGIRTWRHRHRA
jgi:hypothetical protein